MLKQAKLQAVGECKVGFGHNVDVQVFGQQGPVSVAHARVPQALNQGDVQLELLNYATDVQSNILTDCEKKQKNNKNSSFRKYNTYM